MGTAAILERWLETAKPNNTMWAPAATCDPFLNPVEYTLRENLIVLVEQVLGSMDAAAVKAALANILRIRAVQDLSAAEAVGFVFPLRGILRESAPQANPAEADARVDRLALWAFEEYTRCRDQIAALRLHEALNNTSFGPGSESEFPRHHFARSRVERGA